MGALDESGLAILRDWVTDKIGKKRAIMKTLWTNPSPTASFAAQTVTLQSMKDYDFIAILCSYDTSNTYRELTFIPGDIWVGKSVDVFAHINHIETNHTGGRRVSSASETSVTFGTGYYNGKASASRAIPRAIYGVNLNSDVRVNAGTSTVLWQNASPTSQFAAQTITLSDAAANYDFVVLYSKFTNDADQSLVPTVLKYDADYPGFTIPVATSGNYGGGRSGSFITSNNGSAIQFGNGSFNKSATRNDILIPYKILGVNL